MRRGRNEPLVSFLNRLADGLDSEQCWNWPNAIGADGYGLLKQEGKLLRAHRASYQVFVGPVEESKLVLHHCDNRLCFNPKHLYKGTHSNNIADRLARHPRHTSNLCRKQLHPMSGENLYVAPNGARKCKTCSSAFRFNLND